MMQIQISCDLIDRAIQVIALFLFVSVCIAAIVLLWDSLKIALVFVKWTLLWATGAKDFEELGTRMDANHATWRERRLARGEPVTLGDILKVIGQRIWTAYRHPIRTWRGEFDPSKEGVHGAGEHKS